MVSLGPNNLHLITLSTSGSYCEKISNNLGDSSSDGHDHWESHSKWTWDPIQGMGYLITEPVVCKLDGDIFVFGVDSDRRLKYTRYDGQNNKWDDEPRFIGTNADPKWLSKPGTVVGPPSSPEIQLVITGEDRQLYHTKLDRNTKEWTDFRKLIPQWADDAPLLLKEPPVLAISENPARWHVFCVSVDGRLFQAFHDPANEEGSFKLDEVSRMLPDGSLLRFNNQVQVIARKKDLFDLLTIGQDSKLYHHLGGIAFNGDCWGHWEEVTEAKSCRGIPEMISFEVDRVDALVIGINGHVRHLKLLYKDAEDVTTGVWSLVDDDAAGPTNFDRPTAVSRGKGKIDLAIAYSRKGGILHKWYSDNNGWQPPNTDDPAIIKGSPLSRAGTAS